jgi:hypothetical protein
VCADIVAKKTNSVKSVKGNSSKAKKKGGKGNGEDKTNTPAKARTNATSVGTDDDPKLQNTSSTAKEKEPTFDVEKLSVKEMQTILRAQGHDRLRALLDPRTDDLVEAMPTVLSDVKNIYDRVLPNMVNAISSVNERVDIQMNEIRDLVLAQSRCCVLDCLVDGL